MKILYHHRIASKDGQYVHVEELTNAMLEQEHELVWVAPAFTQKAEFGNEGGVAAKLKKKLPKSIYELLELGYSLIIAFKLIRAILREKPDFIYERYQLYQPMGVVVAKLFRLPILLEINAPLVDERAKYSGLELVGLARCIERFTWRGATKALPVTQVLADIVEEGGVKPENIEVIQNGTNANLLETVFAAKQRRNDGTITIGFVGFIHPWHKLELAIEAVAKFPSLNVRLVCVGDGDVRPELEAIAEQLDVADKVEFTGLKSRAEVFDYVAGFDIALQPAVTPYASPLKLFEYLAAGSLIIAPRSPNICEIVDEQSALLFEPDSSDDFQEKLFYAIQHFDELEPLRAQARASIDERHFTWQSNAERVVALASAALGKG